MSDTGRKGLTDKVSESMTPDSQKSTGQKASEGLSGMGDKIGGALQPEGNKSTTQKAGDALSGDSASTGSSTDKSYLQQAQEAVGNTVKSVGDTISGNTGSK